MNQDQTTNTAEEDRAQLEKIINLVDVCCETFAEDLEQNNKLVAELVKTTDRAHSMFQKKISIQGADMLYNLANNLRTANKLHKELVDQIVQNKQLKEAATQLVKNPEEEFTQTMFEFFELVKPTTKTVHVLEGVMDKCIVLMHQMTEDFISKKKARDEQESV